MRSSPFHFARLAKTARKKNLGFCAITSVVLTKDFAGKLHTKGSSADLSLTVED